MPDVVCFTSVSLSYLDRARVLAETVKRVHPDWTLCICICDRPHPSFRFNLDAEAFDRVVWVEDLDIPDIRSWIFKHDVVELCTAVKGYLLANLLDEGFGKVVYLDPDIAVFSSLANIERLLDTSTIVLTPHVVAPEDHDQAIADNEIGTLKHGTYNLGFLAVRNCPEARRFAEWWRSRLHQYCYDDVANGLFTDQRWCDLVPCFFDDVHILRDPGYNVASWNLNRRPISFDGDGNILAGGVPLRFFHFTKVNSIGQIMLTRYAGGALGAFDLLKWYRQRLRTHAVPDLPAHYWAFAHFEDNEPIRREQRLLYRHRVDLQRAFPDPFSVGGHSFCSWYDHSVAAAASQAA